MKPPQIHLEPSQKVRFWDLEEYECTDYLVFCCVTGAFIFNDCTDLPRTYCIISLEQLP